MAPNRPVNSAFAPRSKTSANTTMARARRGHSSYVRLLAASRPVSRSLRVPTTTQPPYPSSTHTHFLSPRTRPPPVETRLQAFPSPSLNPPIQSVRALWTRPLLDGLTCTTYPSIGLPASPIGLLFSCLVDIQCESLLRALLDFGVDIRGRTDAMPILPTVCT